MAILVKGHFVFYDSRRCTSICIASSRVDFLNGQRSLLVEDVHAVFRRSESKFIAHQHLACFALLALLHACLEMFEAGNAATLGQMDLAPNALSADVSCLS